MMWNTGRKHQDGYDFSYLLVTLFLLHVDCLLAGPTYFASPLQFANVAESKVRSGLQPAFPFTLWKSLERFERSAVGPPQNASHCILDHFKDHFEKFPLRFSMVLPPQICYHEIPQSISSTVILNPDLLLWHTEMPQAISATFYILLPRQRIYTINLLPNVSKTGSGGPCCTSS